MIVQLDIVVFRIPPVDLSFNLVSIVIEDKEVRTKTSSEHRADLLDRLPSASSSKEDLPAANYHLRRIEQFSFPPLIPWRRGRHRV